MQHRHLNHHGKAELTGCNPGWNCEGIINHHIGVYGLADTVEHIQGEYNVLVGDAVAGTRPANRS